jgi:fucose 4-O-acetylase-like acetyltransferase
MIGFHHAAAYTVSIMIGWTGGYREVILPGDPLSSFTYLLMWSIRQLDSFGVPAFLFVSGFYMSFLARREKDQLRLDMVTPRIKVLLIPFALWTLVRIALVRQLNFDLSLLIYDVFDMYYYIPLLIQLYILSIFLVPLARSPGADGVCS